MLAQRRGPHPEHQLRTEAVRLDQELEHLQQIVQGEVDIEPDEADTGIFERKKAAAVMDILQRRRQTIKEALHAMEKGLYGICERCGSTINAERLQVKPDATFCLACQRTVESDRRGR